MSNPTQAVQVFSVQGVNSDLDSRKLNGANPNATLAYSASNLNFAASSGSDNFSGGVMNADVVELPYSPTAKPAGTSKAVGRYEDIQYQRTYFAFWNSEANHYVAREIDGEVEIVLIWPGFDFLEDGDVDIAIIDGNIYLTDNNSEPKMFNIDKAIANDYATPYEEWMFTQVKRQPAFPLEVTYLFDGNYIPIEFTLLQASVDYNNYFAQSLGLQFSYYYIYDNNEESRMGPVSRMDWYTINIKLRIPDQEFDDFTSPATTMIKYVVWCFRFGNNGVWYVAKRNTGTNFILVANALLLPKIPVSANITNLQFDDYPLLSATNEIALNRLFLGNYTVSYPNWTGLSIAISQVAGDTIGFGEDGYHRTVLPGTTYSIGVELLDLWGRRIGVVSAKNFTVTPFEYARTLAPQPSPVIVPGPILSDFDNNYHLEALVTGALPDWAAYVRVVYSRTLSVLSFFKTTCRLFVWYQNSEGVDAFWFTGLWAPAQPITPADSVKFGTGVDTTYYTRKGFAVELSSGEPYSFVANTNQYLAVAQEWVQDTAIDPPSPGLVNPKEYKITKMVNNMVFVETEDTLYTPSVASGNSITNDPVDAYYPVYYQVSFYTKAEANETIYWQSTDIVSRAEYEVYINNPPNYYRGQIEGDFYVAAFKKKNLSVKREVIIAVNPATPASTTFTFKDLVPVPYTIEGAYVSMNPTNIYSQDWDSDIGQNNIVIEDQRQTTLQDAIIGTDPIILGSQTNGLSKLDPAINERMPAENGPIKALVATGATQKEPGVMLAWGTVACESIYLNATQITNADATISVNPNLNESTRILASHRPLLGQYGIQRLRNVCETPLGTVYGWSHIANDVVRYAQNGFTALGKTYGIYNELRALAGNPAVIINFSQRLEEVIVIGRGVNAYIFSERSQLWQGRRNYKDGSDTPEMASSLSLREYYVLLGTAYQTDPNSLANNFFGTVRNPGLSLISNVEVMKIKRPCKVVVIGSKPLILGVTTDSGQSINIADTKFQSGSKSTDWFYTVQSANGPGADMDGLPMEGRINTFVFEWDAATFARLHQVGIVSVEPETQTKMITT